MYRTIIGTKRVVCTTFVILTAVALFFLIPASCYGDSLIEAAKRGDASTVNQLLKAGADPNTKDSDGRTALIWAAAKGHKDILNLLFSKGADLNAADNDGNAALIITSAAGNSEIVSTLLSKGANPNSKSKNGFTPLYVAASQGHEKIVRLLLENGADPNKPGYSDISPLAAAVVSKNAKVVEMLLDHGATGPDVIRTKPKADQKSPEKETTTLSEIRTYSNDYLTLLLFILNPNSHSLRKNAIPIFENHNLMDAKIVRDFNEEEDKFKLVLTSNGATPVFKDTWVDPLFKFLNKRGDFPSMSFRNGSVFQNNQNDLVIDSGMELRHSGKTYRYSKDKEWELIR